MELHEYLDQELPQEEEQRKGFVIDNEQTANWVMRKLAFLNEKERQKREIADAEMRRVDEWLENETAAINRDMQFFEAALEVYMRKVNMEDPKVKSLKLIHGKLQLRKQKPKLICDDDKLLQFLKDKHYTPLINRKVKVEEKVDKVKLKKLIIARGVQAVIGCAENVVEGVSILEQEPSFSVTLND